MDTTLASRVRPSDEPGFPLADGGPDSTNHSICDRFRFPLSSRDSALNDLIIRKALCAQTRQQMMCAALACHRYHLANGAWPERLEELIPKYLVAIPLDPLGGGTLIYRQDPKQGFVLYSKGGNGIDDGGDPTLDDPRIVSVMDYGKDLVWAVPATAKEAEEALRKSAF